MTLRDVTVTAVRTPAMCGVADPPYSAEDAFTLTVTGGTDAGTSELITVTLHDTPALLAQVGSHSDAGVDYPLNVPALFSNNVPATQTATANDVSVSLSSAMGEKAVDDNAITSVVLTRLAVPAADGDELSVGLQVGFSDDGSLAQTFSAKVTTVEASCTH
jgi:hypothetical protein